MKLPSTFLVVGLCLTTTLLFGQFSSKTLEVSSPNTKLKVTIEIGKEITYAVSYESEPVVLPSAISLTLQDGTVVGNNAKYRSDFLFIHDRYIRPIFGIQNTIHEHCNELIISFKNDYSLIVRAFDNGMAYRWVTKYSGGIIVKDEKATFTFADNYTAYFHPDLFECSFESDYQYKPIASFKGMSSLPLVVELPKARRAFVAESDLLDYPGMHLVADSVQKGSLKGVFAKYPKSWEKDGERGFDLKVKEREDFIAQTNGSRSLPWRIIGLEEEDKNLLNNQLVYILASDIKVSDVNWIKPGKAAWDWWNALNLDNVSFKTGINNETYEYYIDFAADNNLDYVVLDEGWSNPHNLLEINKDLDLERLSEYARKKNVKLILWCVWHTLDAQLDDAFDFFDRYKIAGIKVDFMDRDDQIAVNFYEKLAKITAQHQMIVDFHGAFKPTGLERTYPNCLTREGVKGLEWNKFDSKGISPEHDVTIPFTRMIAGPMDYTPGAMMNMTQKNWRMIFEQPMSQGTRCHQLAMYVVFYSPLQMLADLPTSYQDDVECLHFLANVPTVWTETLPLASKIGDYVTMARKNGDKWWLASMTDWTPTELDIKLDFLDVDKAYEIEIFEDGVNAERDARDYKRKVQTVRRGENVHITLAAGGGFVACIRPVN